MNGNYSIKPICTGYLYSNKAKIFYHESIHKYYDVDGYVDNPVSVFLLEGDGNKILVDTGMSSTDIASERHIKGSFQPDGYAIQDQIINMGIDTSEINMIILTHLHWDHYYNISKFPKAKIYVQQKEWDFAHDPTPTDYRIYEHPAWHMVPQYIGIEDQFEMVNGDTEIVPGISVYLTPGHSIGHQCVTVNTENGVYHICGDLIYRYDNLDSHEDIAYELTPPAKADNMTDWWNSVLDMKRRAQGKQYILPCHAPEIATMALNKTIIGVKETET